MKVCILAGGLGTRLSEETESKPKPMIEIGGYPILWHIMKIYGASNVKEFILALGYKGDVIKNYFLNYAHHKNDFSLKLKTNKVQIHAHGQEDWNIHFVDTGLKTGTGGRLLRLSSWFNKGTFMMTYGDGVSNVDVRKVLAFHRKHKKLATIVAVRPPARFGGLEFKGDLVTNFIEKPQIGEGWINGGFFILEPGVFDFIDNETTMWESEPLERLVKEKQLVVYRHEEFWQCMDTLRDVRNLNQLWNTNEAPWKIW